MKKICRFVSRSEGEARFGLLDGRNINPLASSNPFNDLTTTGELLHLEDVRLLAPVSPTKIVCVGRNYVEHAVELGNPMPEEPLLFLKPPSSILAPDGMITFPEQSKQVEYEGEIAVVIGRTAKALSIDDDVRTYILGYTCLNDITARDLQRKDVQFTRAKSFDTFCPIGPWITTDLDPANLTVETRVNGITKQSGHSSKMAFGIQYLIRYISHVMTLYPGDVIATGTPAGVSRLELGDIVEVEVSNVGILQNTAGRA
jgi:2-keto-4-pentenoate hydratase/2-oxohepta-3-ene-1,7-dioic acid hydratase in catechol pathway